MEEASTTAAAQLLTTTMVPEAVQHIDAIITSLDLTVLIFAVAAAVFVTPPVSSHADFYRARPKQTQQSVQMQKRENTWYNWFFRMPRAPVVFSWFLFTNICLAISAIYYLYDSRNPAGQTNMDWYASIESLIFVLCILKYLWLGIVWNMHSYMVPMIFAILMAILMPIITIVLIILLGVRYSWVSMALMIPVFFFYIVIPLWTVILFCRYRKAQQVALTRINIHIHDSDHDHHHGHHHHHGHGHRA